MRSFAAVKIYKFSENFGRRSVEDRKLLRAAACRRFQYFILTSEGRQQALHLAPGGIDFGAIARNFGENFLRPPRKNLRKFSSEIRKESHAMSTLTLGRVAWRLCGSYTSSAPPAGIKFGAMGHPKNRGEYVLPGTLLAKPTQ